MSNDQDNLFHLCSKCYNYLSEDEKINYRLMDTADIGSWPWHEERYIWNLDELTQIENYFMWKMYGQLQDKKQIGKPDSSKRKWLAYWRRQEEYVGGAWICSNCVGTGIGEKAIYVNSEEDEKIEEVKKEETKSEEDSAYKMELLNAGEESKEIEIDGKEEGENIESNAGEFMQGEEGENENNSGNEGNAQGASGESF